MKTIIRRSIIIIVFLSGTLSTCDVFASDTLKGYRVRNGVWPTPVGKNTIINGLAIGLMAVPWMKADSLKINGVNAELSLFGIFGSPIALIGTFSAPFVKNTNESSDLYYDFMDSTETHLTKIAGLSVSGGGLVRDIRVSGLAVNGLISFASRVSGLEITGIMNLHYDFNGVMICGLRNKSTKCRGVQIGLINTCKEGKVLQLGLINRIGDRIIPFANFSFKRSSKT